jgi:uncharacterized protein (TIGR02001 family)
MIRVALLLALVAAPLKAAPLVSGEAKLVSDYRFRGISRSDAKLSAQARLGVELGDVYAEAFAASLGGWGRFGGADAEIDISAGVRKPLWLGTVDLGLTLYSFPGAVGPASVVEAQAKLSGAIGPLQLTAGTAWAPPQRGLASATSRRGDNLYIWGAAHADILGTPFAVDARVGHSRGVPGLGGAGALAGSARAWDWRLGMTYATGPFTIGGAVTGTDLGDRANALLRTPRGDRIAGTGVLLSVGAGF